MSEEQLSLAAYEDKVKGAIPEAVCVQLLKRYEDERTEKLEQRMKLSAQLEACHEDEKAADDWLALIRDRFYCSCIHHPLWGAFAGRGGSYAMIIIRLDRVLADRKMRLNDLAAQVGISNVNLSYLKTGKVKAVRFSTLDAICKVLKCQPGDILEYIEDED